MIIEDKYLPTRINECQLDYEYQKEQYQTLKSLLGKEAALINYLHLKEFERLYHSCDDLVKQDCTSQVVIQAIMPLVHKYNPYLSNSEMIDTTNSRAYTKLYADERESMLRSALDLHKPSNTFICRLFAILETEKSDIDRDLYRLLNILWHVLNIFSYPSRQNGKRDIKDSYRTFYMPKYIRMRELSQDSLFLFLSNLA